MFKTNQSVITLLLQNLSALQIQSRCASYANRESRMLQKLMSGKKKPTFKWSDETVKKPSTIYETKKTPGKLSTRRTIVLNKLFMRHVTDLIASGSIGYELKGLGLEITRVTVCQNYHELNILWTATGSDLNFDYIEQKLESIKRQLRHELHQMQLMGNMPHLTFVRDEQVSYFDVLGAVVEKADYGEDYEPGNKKSKLKTDFDIQDVGNVNDKDSTSTLPPMRHDVCGLNHALIMGRIKQSMAKSKQAWKAYEDKQKNLTEHKPFTFNTSFESIREEQISDKNSSDILKEQAEFNAQLMNDENWSNDANDEEDNSNDWIEDEEEVQKFYDEYESFEK